MRPDPAPTSLSTERPGARPAQRGFGDHLRHWRQHRRLSQLDLAHEADISTRHLSFVETGRSVPSREMVLRLSERLDIPLRERNALLVAAGYAPMYRERPLDDPALASARQAVELLLKSHEPYPALAVDRHWNLVAANRMVAPMMGMGSGTTGSLCIPASKRDPASPDARAQEKARAEGEGKLFRAGAEEMPAFMLLPRDEARRKKGPGHWRRQRDRRCHLAAAGR